MNVSFITAYSNDFSDIGVSVIKKSFYFLNYYDKIKENMSCF